MSRATSDAQRVLDDNRRMAATIATLQRKERQLTTTTKMQRSDIESFKKRLEQFCAENDDLLEKLAEMKRDRAQCKRQFDEQMKQVTDELQQLKNTCDPQSDSDQLRETRRQLEEACQNADRLQQELDAERRRCAELERVKKELQLQTTQPPLLQVHNVKWKQQLENQVRALTRELVEARQRLTDQTNAVGKLRENTEQLKCEKTEFKKKNREQSSALDNLKQSNAMLEQQKDMLLEQLDQTKLALEACNITKDAQKKQLQSTEVKKQEMEQSIKQIRAEQSGAKGTERMLRDELKKMKQAENERTAEEVELRSQLTKAEEDYTTLRLKTQADVDRLQGELKEMNEEVHKLKKVNLYLVNNERQMKAELDEAKREAEQRRDKLQQEIETLRVDLQVSEGACIKHRRERDEVLEKFVPKERLEKVVTELKRLRRVMEETDSKIQKLQDEQDVLQRKTQEREQELNQEMEKMRSELKLKDELLEKAAEQSLELENKNEKLKQLYNEKEKLLRKEHEKLEQTMKEQHGAFQEKIQTTEAQHLAEKEHMLKMYKEKEKELKNKMKVTESEIRAETDRLKSKCEQLEMIHAEKLRQKDEETLGRIKKLKVEVKERSKLVEETNEKNKELQKTIDEQVHQTNELKTLQSVNDELKEKVGKLERALLRLRLDNDELRESKEHSGKNGEGKELVGEQTTRITDLQLQVNMLLQALEDRSKPLPRRSITDAGIQSSSVDHERLLREMKQLLKSTSHHDSKRVQVADSSTLARELEAERNKVRAGSERIAQLERWLDTIFNDQQFGIGLSAAFGGTERMSQISLPPVNGSSSVSAVGKSKTQTASRTIDRSPDRQKQTRISKTIRQ